MMNEEAISYFKVLLLHLQSCNSSVNIVPRIQAGQTLGIIVQFLAGTKDFSYHQSTETDSKAFLAYEFLGSWKGISPQVK
jgi:hypothetical protein